MGERKEWKEGERKRNRKSEKGRRNNDGKRERKERREREGVHKEPYASSRGYEEKTRWGKAEREYASS